MIDYSKLKALAEALIAANERYLAAETDHDLANAFTIADDTLQDAMPPETVLCMISELEKFDDGMRALAFSLGAGGYNAVTLTADQLVGKVSGGLEMFTTSTGGLLDKVTAERDQLKAENERLRADYAALSTFNPDWDRVAAAQDSVRENLDLANHLKAELEEAKAQSNDVWGLAQGRADAIDQLKAINFDYEVHAHAADEEIARLKAENSDYKAGQDRYEDLCENQRGVIRALKEGSKELRKDATRELFDALAGLVKANEAHNLAMQKIIGRPTNWNDSYLDAARAAIAKANKAPAQGEIHE